MPRIPTPILNCALYVYRSVDDARDGLVSGGSGFVSGFVTQWSAPNRHLYAVTNKHVILKAGRTPTLRLNRVDGTMDIVRTDADSWLFHPDGDDLALLPVSLSDEHEFACVNTDIFLKSNELSGWVGPGTEAIMIGRFVGHEGRQKNTPALRYGNIAMLPDEPIPHDEFGIAQESFLVEMRSLPGYSGSPVFAVRFPFKFRHDGAAILTNQPDAPPPWWLTFLGVDWCHLNNYERVCGEDKKPLPEKLYVRANTGMAGVIPAWRLRTLLELDELVLERERRDAERRRGGD